MKYGELTTGCIIEYIWFDMLYMYLIVDIRISVSNRISAHCLTPDGKLELWCADRELNEHIKFGSVTIL